MTPRHRKKRDVKGVPPPTLALATLKWLRASESIWCISTVVARVRGVLRGRGRNQCTMKNTSTGRKVHPSLVLVYIFISVRGNHMLIGRSTEVLLELKLTERFSCSQITTSTENGNNNRQPHECCGNECIGSNALGCSVNAPWVSEEISDNTIPRDELIGRAVKQRNNKKNIAPDNRSQVGLRASPSGCMFFWEGCLHGGGGAFSKVIKIMIT